MTKFIIPTDGMILTEDTVLTPGAYVLPNGLHIGADNIVIEGRGVLITSPTQTGIGLQAQGRHGVTVRNIQITGFHHGVRFDDCAAMTLDAITVRGSAEIAGIDTFLYLWQPLDQAYGGAVVFASTRDSAIRDCDLQHQMHGVQLYGCTGVTVERINASFNSGWGIYLSSSSECVIRDNRLDFCNRMFRREDGSVRVEADASGIVLVKGSSRNQFLRNSCVCGGDGIFVAGYCHPGDIQPCNDNVFEDNDCRLSPNNAIESTFSRGNIFRRNDCSRSNYGFWMGYSWDNVIEDNVIEFNRWAGIAAEHAHGFAIRGNRIRLNGDGVRLWTRGGEVIPYWPSFEVSYDVTLTDNLIESNTTGFTAYTGDETTAQCHDLHLHGNRFLDNRIGAHFARVEASALVGSTFVGSLQAAVRLVGTPDVRLEDNVFEDNAQDTLAV